MPATVAGRQPIDDQIDGDDGTGRLPGRAPLGRRTAGGARSKLGPPARVARNSDTSASGSNLASAGPGGATIADVRMSDRHDEKKGPASRSAAAAARHHRVPAHGGAAVRRAREVDQRARRGDGQGRTRRSSSPPSARRRPTSRSPEDIFAIGTVGTIIQLLRLPDGTVKVLVEGKRRARIRRFVQTDEFFTVEVEEIAEVARALGRARRADARGAGDVRDLRQAEQADRARDADLGADDRRSRRSSPTPSSRTCSSSSPTSRRSSRWTRRRSASSGSTS